MKGNDSWYDMEKVIIGLPPANHGRLREICYFVIGPYAQLLMKCWYSHYLDCWGLYWSVNGSWKKIITSMYVEWHIEWIQHMVHTGNNIRGRYQQEMFSISKWSHTYIMASSSATVILHFAYSFNIGVNLSEYSCKWWCLHGTHDLSQLATEGRMDDK